MVTSCCLDLLYVNVKWLSVMKIHPILISSCVVASAFLLSGCASNNSQNVGLGYAPNDLAVKGVDLRTHFANAELYQSPQPDTYDQVATEPVRKKPKAPGALSFLFKPERIDQP